LKPRIARAHRAAARSTHGSTVLRSWRSWLLPALAALATASTALAIDAPAGRAADLAQSRTSSRFELLRAAAPGLDPDVLALALEASDCALRAGFAPEARYLAVIDYSLPSNRERFWVLDLAANAAVASELVAHGANTGENVARRFSNVEGSRQSSLGLFRTAETYDGSNGYSLRLDGLEEGVNDRARERAIVMHGAWYVSKGFAREHGRLGRSWGCPALDLAVSRKVIDRIQGGHLLFSYYPDAEWLATSRFLRCGKEPRVAAGSDATAPAPAATGR
jgi:hypothetical protein